MKTKAVISVTGRDNVGIIAKVSALCAKYGANIIDISQTVLKDYFAMIMIVEIDGLNIEFTDFVDIAAALGRESFFSSTKNATRISIIETDDVTAATTMQR